LKAKAISVAEKFKRQNFTVWKVSGVALPFAKDYPP
jgi:hypothetical protein